MGILYYSAIEVGDLRGQVPEAGLRGMWARVGGDFVLGGEESIGVEDF